MAVGITYIVIRNRRRLTVYRCWLESFLDENLRNTTNLRYPIGKTSRWRCIAYVRQTCPRVEERKCCGKQQKRGHSCVGDNEDRKG